MSRTDSAQAAAAIDGNTAAVILELVQGLAGAFDLDPGFVRDVAAACKRKGALLIIDEVQTGVGRCGAGFAAQVYGLQPDILTTAKALATGFPCGAVLVTEDVAGCLHNGDLGTTFGGGPLACRLIATVIDVIHRDKLLDNVQRLSARIKTECLAGPVTSVHGKGFLLGLRCRGGAARVREQLLKESILTGSSNDPDVVRLLPPLVLEDRHVDQLVATIRKLRA